MAVFGELQGVGGIVEQGLLEPGRVAKQMAGLHAVFGADDDALLPGALGQHRGAVLQYGADVHRNLLKGEFAGFDLG
jgi:hypothetical protein